MADERDELKYERCPGYIKLRSDLNNLGTKLSNINEDDIQPLKKELLTRVSLKLYLTTIIIASGIVGSIWLMNWSIKGSIHEIDKKVSNLSTTHDALEKCIAQLTINVTELTINQRIRLDRERREEGGNLRIGLDREKGGSRQKPNS